MDLPLTPFHYPLAYVIYKLDEKLILPPLVVGSMFPDLEVPAIVLLFGNRIPHHLLFHSLLGAATIGTTFSVAFTIYIYPSLVSGLFGIDKCKVKSKCRLSSALVFSALLGNMSHVLLDVVNHINTPIFWPFTPSYMLNPVPSVLGGLENASLMIHALMGILFLLLLINKRHNLLERLLVE